MSVEFGEKLTLPESCFPRYQYFKNHLHSVVERLQRIVDGADLLKFYCNGADKLSSIRSHSKSFYTDVKVYLFDRRSVLKAEQLMVKNIPLSDGKIRTNLKEFLRESKNISPFECHLAMVVIQQEQYQELTRELTGISENQQSNILIYDEDFSTTYSYKDAHLSKSFPPFDSMSNDSVCLTIQRLLETKLVHFLQHLRHFVLQLVPNNVCDLTGDSEEDAFAKHLAERIYEKFTCKDFQHSAVDDSGAIDEKKLRINLTYMLSRLTVCLLCEHMALQLGISTKLLHCTLSEVPFKKQIDKMSAILMDKTETSGETTEKLEEPCSEVFQTAKEAVVTVMRFFKLMKKLDLELKGLIKQSDVFTSLSRDPKLPQELCKELLKLKGIKNIGHKYGKLVLCVKKDMTLTSEDVQWISRLLKTHGYMFSFTIEPEMVEITQADTLSVFENGNRLKFKSNSDKKENCEDVFGTLGCFVTLKKSNTETKKVKTSDSSCKLKKEAKVNVLYERSKHETESHDFTCDKLYATKAEKENTSDCKPNKDEDVDVINKRSKNETELHELTCDKLYALTCAHCIRNCKNSVEACRTGNEFEPFGNIDKNLTLEDKNCLYIDLACISVLPYNISKCEVRAKQSSKMVATSNWQVYPDYPIWEGASVYIFGGTSSLSKGVVIEADRIQMNLEGRDIANMALSFALLIEPVADLVAINKDIPQFSQEGDSGSVVWFSDANGNIFALALLCGIMKKDDETFTYASYLEPLFNLFAEKKGLTIEPACISDDQEKDNTEKVQKLDKNKPGDSEPAGSANGQSISPRKPNDRAASHKHL